MQLDQLSTALPAQLLATSVAPSVPHQQPAEWPDRPLFVRDAHSVCASAQANSGVPARFETDLFAGALLVYVDGLPSSPAWFKNKRRRSHLVIQVCEHAQTWLMHS